MVEIKYINGDIDNVEIKESKVTEFYHSHFRYDAETPKCLLFLI